MPRVPGIKKNLNFFDAGVICPLFSLTSYQQSVSVTKSPCSLLLKTMNNVATNNYKPAILRYIMPKMYVFVMRMYVQCTSFDQL